MTKKKVPAAGFNLGGPQPEFAQGVAYPDATGGKNMWGPPPAARALATIAAPEIAVPAMVAEKAAEEAAGIGQAVVKAATAPIWRRKTVEVYDAENEEWVPLTRERERNITPAAILVAALAFVGIGAVAQRGIRTGTVQVVDVTYWTVAGNPKHFSDFREASEYAAAHAKLTDVPNPNWTPYVLTNPGDPTPQFIKAAIPLKITRHDARRTRLRGRANVADYNGPGTALFKFPGT